MFINGRLDKLYEIIILSQRKSLLVVRLQRLNVLSSSPVGLTCSIGRFFWHMKFTSIHDYIFKTCRLISFVQFKYFMFLVYHVYPIA